MANIPSTALALLYSRDEGNAVESAARFLCLAGHPRMHGETLGFSSTSHSFHSRALPDSKVHFGTGKTQVEGLLESHGEPWKSLFLYCFGGDCEVYLFVRQPHPTGIHRSALIALIHHHRINLSLFLSLSLCASSVFNDGKAELL